MAKPPKPLLIKMLLENVQIPAFRLCHFSQCCFVRWIKFIAKIHVSVYRTSLQLQIDDYITSTSIKQLGGK